MARSGRLWRVMAWQAWLGLERQGSEGRGWFGLGMAGMVRLVPVRQGLVLRGAAGKVGQGMARRGMARSVGVRNGRLKERRN